MAQILAFEVRLLSGENLLQEKNSTGYRWDSYPAPCRLNGHCCKYAKPSQHLDTFYLASFIGELLNEKDRRVAPQEEVAKCCIISQIGGINFENFHEYGTAQ